MKLREYLEELNTMVQERPEILDYELVYSSDDEGNYYHKIFYTPGIGYFSEDYVYYEEGGEEFVEFEFTPNVVCMN